MIRDFWGIRKGRLTDEIAALKDKVDPDVWDAIEAVRGVGNIGAHMEKDIDVIVSVDPGEAQLLIELIEQLFEEWYVAKHERAQRMTALVTMAGGKNETKKGRPESEALGTHKVPLRLPHSAPKVET